MVNYDSLREVAEYLSENAIIPDTEIDKILDAASDLKHKSDLVQDCLDIFYKIDDNYEAMEAVVDYVHEKEVSEPLTYSSINDVPTNMIVKDQEGIHFYRNSIGDYCYSDTGDSTSFRLWNAKTELIDKYPPLTFVRWAKVSKG